MCKAPHRMKLFKVLMILVCLELKTYICGEIGQFNGGSLSFMVIEGTNGFEIRLDLISGWVLGLGPCGLNCSRASINSDTNLTRKKVMQLQNDPYYFGNWTVTYKLNGSNTVHVDNINNKIYNNMVQKVIDVSAKGNWEQDLMFVRIPMISGATYMDISYEGTSWRNLSLQSGKREWHLHVKVNKELRSDTGKPNNSPQAFGRPIYRVLLGYEKHIRVATLDPEGDLVKCKISEYVEAGILSTKRLPNVTVTEDCIIKVPAIRSLGYYNGSWGGIAVTVRDYRETMSPMSSAAVTLQFLVQFLDVVNEPSLILETPEDGHRFIVYYGTTWYVHVFAVPISPAIIDHFSYVGRQGENLTFIDMKDKLDKYYKNAKQATLTWTPLQSETGEHTVCVNVEDSVGMDSSDPRCYSIAVKPFYDVTQPTNIPNDKPYFINLPDKDILLCDVNATCIFPVYAKTPNIGNDLFVGKSYLEDIFQERANIASIWVGKYFLELAENDTKIAITGNGISKMDLRIKHSSDGSPSLCLHAMDTTGAVSNETCINPKIMPPDPCLKQPCVHGTCKRNTDDLSQFYCQCVTDHYYGKLCEKEKTDCPPQRCQHGICKDFPGEKFACICPSEWQGTLCDLPKSSCMAGYCNSRGYCKNEVFPHYSCDCFQRFEGPNCTTDKCPQTYRDNRTCSEKGCNASSCANNGLCTEGGICHCSLGFEGSLDCRIGKGDLSNQKVNFVEPTPTEGSVITCFNSEPCTFSVFIAGGSNPTVGIQHVSGDLKHILNVSTPVVVPYVPGIQNMFESRINIDAPPLKTYLGQQYVCLEAHNSTTHLVGSSHRCFNIFYISNPLIRQTEKFKFIDPTPKANSRFLCGVNQTCHLFVYTNADNTSKCHEVVSLSGVFVQPAILNGSSCFIDVSYNFSHEGYRTHCLKADDIDGESRCFTMDFIGPSSDPCLSNPCQNNGICLRKDNSDFVCICGKEYKGPWCEKGPCLLTDSKCQHGYCEVNNKVQTCFCPLGYKGTKCDIAIPDEVKALHNNTDIVSIFTDMFIPEEIVCVKSKPCVIPFVVSGNYPFPSKPTVDVGYVSPSIEINGIKPLEKISTNGTYTSDIMFTPNVPGNQKMCLQTLRPNRINFDEICFNVDVKPDAFLLYGEKDKPHFTAPSIQQYSTVICKPGVTCHMMFTVSSGRSNMNKCSSVKLVEGLTENYHIFSDCETCIDGPAAVNNCTMDLVFNPFASHSDSHHLCLEAQLKWSEVTGEIRCFDIKVYRNDSDLRRPCAILHCMNGGFCNAENAGRGYPACHCPVGFSGRRCESVGSPSISNNTNKPSVGNLALPVEIDCNYNESCFIPFLLLGQSYNIPIVGTGHIPPTIAVEKLVINSTRSMSKQFDGYLQIRPTGNATQPVCIQSMDESSTSHVSEEICFKVHVREGHFYRPPVDKSRPYYIDPTLPDSSTVLCKTDSECHILMYTSKTSSVCPTVSETQDYTNGVHIFLAASRNGYDCVTDISYIPPTNIPGPKKMCLQVSLPGFKGEVRCYGVISLENANLSSGLCINKECMNGGHCDSNSQEARCICRVGYGGGLCTGSSKFVDPPNASPVPHATDSPVFTDLAIPDTLICYVGLECWLPIIVNGNNDPNKPTLEFGSVDQALTPKTHILDGGIVRGVYSGNVSFIPKASGEYSLCVRTADPASQHNIDEICFKVMVLDSSGSNNQPPFRTPTLNANSTVKCQVNTTCHILSYMFQENGKCPELIQTSVVENIFVFSPVTTEGKCVVDTAFIPSGTQMGMNTVCLTTRNSANTRCIDVRVVEKIYVATSSTTTLTTTTTTTTTMPSTSQTTTVFTTSPSTQATPLPTTATSTTMVTSQSTATTTSPSTTVTSQSPAPSSSTQTTLVSTAASSQAAATSSTVVTSKSTSPAVSVTIFAKSSTTTETTTTTKTTTMPSTSQTTTVFTTSPSTQATSPPAAITTATSTAMVTSQSTATTTSPSTQATSPPAAITTATSTAKVTSQSTATTTSPSTKLTSRSPAPSSSTQTTLVSAAASSQAAATSSTAITSKSTSPAVSVTTFAKSSTTTETTTKTKTTTMPSTSQTTTVFTTSPSTQATSPPAAITTATSTAMVTSQSTATTTSPSTQATSPPAAITTATSTAKVTSQSTATTTSPSTTLTSRSPAPSSSTETTLVSTAASPQAAATSSTAITSKSTSPAVSVTTFAKSSTTTETTTTTKTTTMPSTSQTTTVFTSLSTQAISPPATTATSTAMVTSQSAATTSPSTTVTSQSPAPSSSTQTTLVSTAASPQAAATSSTAITSKSTSPAVSVTTYHHSRNLNAASFPSTQATSQPAAITTASSRTMTTSHSTLPTSWSTAITSTSTVLSQSTSTTSQSPSTFVIQETPQSVAAPTLTPTKMVTTQSTLPTSQSTETTNSPSTTITTQSTSTTFQSTAKSTSTQAPLLPAATTSATMGTSKSTLPTSQSTAPTNSPSTGKTSQSTLTTFQSPAVSDLALGTLVSTAEASQPASVTSTPMVSAQSKSPAVSTTILAAGIAGGVVGVTVAAGVGTFMVKKLRKRISLNKLSSPRSNSRVHPETLPE